MFAAALLMAAAAPGCVIDHARYVLRDDASVTLRFHVVPRTDDWSSELAAEMRLGRTGRASWWLPMLNSSSDPRYFRWTALKGSPQARADYRYRLGDLRYFAFDRGYGMINRTPHRGDPAPAHLLLADLRDAFYYQDDAATRSSPPQSLFDLVSCDGSADRPDVVFPSVP